MNKSLKLLLIGLFVTCRLCAIRGKQHISNSSISSIAKNKKNYYYLPRIPTSFNNNLLVYFNSNQKPIEYGICSYYHNFFHNKKTATGDIFDQWKWTAAHRTLPLPSIILVCYLDSNKRLKGAIVLVNDRGPYVYTRMLDVSYSLAKEMGFLHQGTMKVVIFFLKNDTMQLASNSRYQPKYSGTLTSKQIIEVLKDNNIHTKF